MYNYLENVISDVLNAIRDNYTTDEIAKRLFYDRDEFAETLNDDFWIDDSVTGNASGSYYCNSWKAEESLNHNWDLICEVANEFGIEPIISDGYENGPEYWDVSIRCYLLSQAIDAALDELEDDEEITEIMDRISNDAA